MEWKKRRKSTIGVLLILVLLIVNSVSYIMADEYTIPTAELAEESETQDETTVVANSISGVIWLDGNNDGILDEDEAAISDYPVNLYSEGDLTEEIQKVTTDQEGKYEFSELEPGEYIVGVKAEENETGYLLPVTKVTDDTTNKFAVDAETLTAAYSEIITIAEDGVITDISCGMGQTAEQTENEDADSNDVTNDNPDAITGDNAESNDNDSINSGDVQEAEEIDAAEDDELQNEDLTAEEQEMDPGRGVEYFISPSDLDGIDTVADALVASPMSVTGGYELYHDYVDASTLINSYNTLGDACSALNSSSYTTFYLLVNDDDLDVGASPATIGASSTVYLRSKDTTNICTLTQKSARHFNVSGTLNLQYITLEGSGDTSTIAGTDEIGGIVVDYNGTLIMSTDATIQNCVSYWRSSAIWLYDGAHVEMNAGTICNNEHIGVSYGGAIGTVATTAASFDMSGGTISNNTTYNTSGGGINFLGAGSVKITGGEISKNSCSVSGGGIFCSSGTALTIDGANISNNTAAIGGGVYAAGGVEFYSGTITGNSAKTGGGVYVSGSYTFNMVGSAANPATISNNTATSGGGGVYVNSTTTEFNITSPYCYITGNNCSSSSGVYSNGIVNMQAGSISNNTGCGVRVVAGTFTMGGISDCYIESNIYSTGYGGGIYVDGGTFYMTTPSCFIRYNESLGGGGVNVAGGTFEMQVGTITENTANSGGGVRINGGIFNMGGSGACEITKNTATGFAGGGVHQSGGTFNMTTTDCNISGNSCTLTSTSGANGGGVYMSDGVFNMEAGTIGGSGSPNSANYGAGVYVQTTGTFTMGGTDTCYISYNDARINGGGVYVGSGAAFEMNSTISYIDSNTATGDGGGAYLNSSSGTFTATNGSIINNSANGDGGGIYTKDYSYASPASETKYSNIDTASTVEFTGNTASESSLLPSNYANFGNLLSNSTSSQAHILNNFDVNYKMVYYTVTYNANGGTGTTYADANQPSGYLYTALSDTDLQYTRTNYSFDGWNTLANGTGTPYAAGQQFALTGNVTLYAQWKLNTSSIEITKSVTGTLRDPNKEFEITITLRNSSGALVTGTSYAYTGSAISGVTPPGDSNITFTSGKGTFKLKHGQTITIIGIPWGYTYAVQETDAAVANGTYTAAYSGTGTLSAEGDSISETLSDNATVSIINNRDSVPESGLNGMDYRLGAVGLLAILTGIITMIWCYRRRKKCK